MKHTKPSFEKLIELARKHQPEARPGEFGFETRLRAALRESDATVLDAFAALSLKFSYACFPVLLAIAVFLAMQSGMAVPSGISGLIAHWTDYIPVGI